MKQEGDCDTNCKRGTRNDTPRLLKSRESENEPMPFKLHYCWDQREYWEESWKPEESCCHSDSSERPLANAGVKNSHEWNNNNNNNNNNRLCSDRDETINHIISECSKLAQKKYKNRHGWVGKVIDSDICKKLKFDHTNKWYMHNPALV